MDIDDETGQFSDNEITTPSKLDSLWLGLMVGMVAPVISFVMFYYSSFTKVSFDYFIQYSVRIGALINILTVCLIPDFLIFALFIWRKHYSSARGLVIASASLTILIIGTKVWLAVF
ncbi:MAG TPA: hypothetical protein VIH57_05965 [Bacteroidales bacterium]